jgi:hypothetical protein
MTARRSGNDESEKHGCRCAQSFFLSFILLLTTPPTDVTMTMMKGTTAATTMRMTTRMVWVTTTMRAMMCRDTGEHQKMI